MPNSQQKILIVDDQAPLRQVFRAGLRALGHLDILEAEDGVEALEVLSATIPAVVVLDALMPRLDGIGVLREIRANPQLAGIPVIMISSMADTGYVNACRALGVAGFLIKPFTIEALGSRVAWCLQEARSQNATPAPSSETASDRATAA